MSYYYWDKEKEMVLINDFQTWKTGHGEGDALWRTSIAYITSGDSKFKFGILKAFNLETKRNKKGYIKRYNYQSCRCNPRFREDDVSRDQVIMAWTSLYFNNEHRKLREIVTHTKYRLSDRYFMTITMWLWSRGLIGKKILGQLGQLSLSIELSVSVIWNILIKKLIGYKEYSPEEIEKMMSKDNIGENIRKECLNSKWKELLWKVNFPGYGLHLAAWMNYTGPNGFFKKINNFLIGVDMSKYNLLLKLLINKSVIEEEIEDFIPTEEWIWSQRMTKMNRNRQLPEEEKFSYDKEILRTIKKRNSKNTK